MRSAAVPAVMTAFVALAGWLLAMRAERFEAFFFLVAHDARTEVPVIAVLVALAMGASVAGAVARRQGVASADDVAAALLGLAALPLAGNLAFELRFWPAFAANRVTYGLDLTDLGVPLASAGLALYFGLAWWVARVLGRKPAAASTRRPVTIALVAITGVTAILVGLAARHMQAHPRGYLGELRRAPLPASVAPGPPMRTEDLCVFPTDDPKKLDVVVVGHEQPCPADGAAGARLEGSSMLLRDAAHDGWFRPSRYYTAGEGYYSQLEGPAGIVTLHDVGAPPPFGIVYAAGMALGVVAILGLEGLKRRRPPPLLAVAVVGLFAMPLWVAAAVGVVL